MKKPFRLLVLALVMLLAFSAVLPTSAQTARSDIRIVVVTHGQASDPFWSVVKNGVDQAAEDLGITVEYQAPETFDMVAMSQLIDAAVASEPDGLIVSIPDADALGDSLRAAMDAGIPVISINSGSDVAEELGVLAHVGQTEYDAGFGGGKRLAEAGATNGLCVIHESGNLSLELRCQGFADAMAEAGGTVELLEIDGSNPSDAKNRISTELIAGGYDAIFTLGPLGATPTLLALEENGMLGQVMVATFDLSPEVLEAIGAGNMMFAIDQQQYLQGYLSVLYMTLYLENLNTPGSLIVPTGPGFVTAENADAIVDLAGQGTR